MQKYVYLFVLCLGMSVVSRAEDADSIIVVGLSAVEIISPKEQETPDQRPTAVSVVTEQTMEENQTRSLKDISSFVPNFFIPDYGSRLTSAIYIRGIGSRINTPAVGLYVDNMPYVDKSAFDFHFYDIERVEVLRGPQGTLYGRNTMGGLVNVYTKNPFSGTGTDVKFGVSSRDNRYHSAVTHYHRISDDFAFTAGGYYEGARGMFTNSTTGRRVDHMKSGGGRIRGIYLPASNLKFDLSVSYDNSDEGAYPYYYKGVVSGDEEYPQLIGVISSNRESAYRRSLFNAGLNTEYRASTWQINSVTSYQSLGDCMTLDQDFLQPDIYTMEQHQRINTLGEELTFRSRRTDAGKPLWEWVNGANFMYQWLHTEAPVTFHSDGLRWLERNINSVMPDMSNIQMLSRMGFSSMNIGFAGDELHMDNSFETPTLNLAAFHQSTFNLTQRLSFTLGLRLNYERQSIDYDAPADMPYTFVMANANPRMAVNLTDLVSHLSYKGNMHDNYFRVLPRFAIKYDLPSSRGNIYFSVTEGMRSGGYNLQMFSDMLEGAMRTDMMTGVKQGVNDYLTQLISSGAAPMPPTVPAMVSEMMDSNMPKFEVPETSQVVYRPEYTWNYEAGSHLNLADGRFTVDGTIYFMTTRQQQIVRFAPGGLGRMMVNAGRSRSYGAEATLHWMPDMHFMLAANYGYTHSTFTHYDDGTTDAAGQPLNYDGNYIPFVPMHTANIDVSYTWQLRRPTWLKSVGVGGNGIGMGRMYWTEANDRSQNFYVQLGARLVLHASRFDITVWGKNLTGTHFDTFCFESANHVFSQKGKPTQFGVDVKLSL